MGYTLKDYILDAMNIDMVEPKHFGVWYTKNNNFGVYLEYQDNSSLIAEIELNLENNLSYYEQLLQETLIKFETAFKELVIDVMKEYTEALEQVNNDTIEWDVFFEDYDYPNISVDVPDEILDKLKEAINWDKIDIDKVWND